MGENVCPRKPWEDKMDQFRETWECCKCHRYCPNCAGRSCYKCCIKKLETGLFTEEELKDTSQFGQRNSGCLFSRPPIGGKPPYNVSNWSTDVPDPLAKNPYPLMRPPWPWEQPRYEPNMRLPSTYVSPAEYREEEEVATAEGDGRRHNFGVEVPPLSYHLRQCYKTRDPLYILRY